MGDAHPAIIAPCELRRGGNRKAAAGDAEKLAHRGRVGPQGETQAGGCFQLTQVLAQRARAARCPPEPHLEPVHAEVHLVA